jgi:hypothetical protein
MFGHMRLLRFFLFIEFIVLGGPLCAQAIVPPLEDPTNQVNSSTNRYVISLPGHFYWLSSTRLGSSQFTWVKQINDIDVSLLGVSNYGNIGSSVNPLRMDYEGGGNQILGISYVQDEHRRSFFTYLKDCIITNLILRDPSITGSMHAAAGFSVYAVNSQFTNCQVAGGLVHGAIMASGFVAEATNSTFTNCSSDCTLISDNWGCAGIAFQCVNTAIIKCSVYGTSTELSTVSGGGKASGLPYRGMGGIAGTVDATTTIIDSFCDADITWNNSATVEPFGGVAGRNDGKIENSYFSGSILSTTPRTNCKPIVGYGNVYNGTGTPSNTSVYQSQPYFSSIIQTNAIPVVDMTDNTLTAYATWLSDGGWLMSSGINNNLPYQPASVYVTSSTNSGTSSNVTVPANTTYTVNPGVVLSVDTLKNYGNILLSANANGYSQLKFNYWYKNTPGDRGANVIAQEQHLESGSHLISSPVSTGFTTTSGDNSKLYAFDASLGNWTAMGSNVSTAGLGYAARVDASQIPFLTAVSNVSVSGTPNTSNTWTISNASLATSTGSGAGWNLLGNPYTCGLDFSNVYSNNSSLIENAFYIWDATAGGGAGGYVYYSGGGLSSPIIPPMQAFWVQAKTSQSGSITTTMSADGTVASSPTYYKTRPDNLVLHAALLGDTLISDRMWVAHVAGTTTSFDGAYDAWKMTNGPSMPNIYSYVDAEGIAINALDLNGNQIIPVGFDYVDVGAKFRITLEQVTNGQVYQVYLEDKALQQFHDLNQGDYPFTHQVWTQEEPRFALHVSQSTVGTEESDASPTSLVIYQDGARLMVHWYDSDQANYRLVTVDGKEVSKGAIQSGLQSLDAPVVSGVYILELAHPYGVERQKFLVTY